MFTLVALTIGLTVAIWAREILHLDRIFAGKFIIGYWFVTVLIYLLVSRLMFLLPPIVVYGVGVVLLLVTGWRMVGYWRKEAQLKKLKKTLRENDLSVDEEV